MPPLGVKAPFDQRHHEHNHNHAVRDTTAAAMMTGALAGEDLKRKERRRRRRARSNSHTHSVSYSSSSDGEKHGRKHQHHHHKERDAALAGAGLAAAAEHEHHKRSESAPGSARRVAFNLDGNGETSDTTKLANAEAGTLNNGGTGGYETDYESDSLDGNRPASRHARDPKHRHARPRSVSDSERRRRGHHHHHHKIVTDPTKSTPDLPSTNRAAAVGPETSIPPSTVSGSTATAAEEVSDASTVELPRRFDEQGRRVVGEGTGPGRSGLEEALYGDGGLGDMWRALRGRKSSN